MPVDIRGHSVWAGYRTHGPQREVGSPNVAPVTQAVGGSPLRVVVHVDDCVQSEGPIVTHFAAKFCQGTGAVDSAFVEVPEDVALSLRG